VLITTNPPTGDSVGLLFPLNALSLTQVQVPGKNAQPLHFMALEDFIAASPDITPDTILFLTDLQDVEPWFLSFNYRDLTPHFGQYGLGPILDYLPRLIGAFTRLANMPAPGRLLYKLSSSALGWVKYLHRLVTVFVDVQEEASSAPPVDRYDLLLSCHHILTLPFQDALAEASCFVVEGSSSSARRRGLCSQYVIASYRVH
jgi:hypothetical protein